MYSRSPHPVFSAHVIHDADELPFSASDYCNFKYGSKSIARKFGKELALKFRCSYEFDNLASLGMPMVIVPSPYHFIPTATYAMKDYFMPYVNERLIELNLPPMQEAKIFRRYSYTSDYGAMDAQARQKAIGADQFHIDPVFLQNKAIIFLDDIKITGAHEERVKTLVKRSGLEHNHIIYTYYARIKEGVQIDPSIENELNYFNMKSLLDLNRIIRDDQFIFNTRNVKFILSSPCEECKNFLDYQTSTFIDTLYHYTIANCYHNCPEFKRNYNYLKSLVL